jgi:hypothetical protein
MLQLLRATAALPHLLSAAGRAAAVSDHPGNRDGGTRRRQSASHPAQYRTVMLPQSVMVAREGVQYEQTPAQYAVRQHFEMVAPARTCYVATPPRCGNCGY